MTNLPLSRDITHITLAVLFIGVAAGRHFWIMRPFLLALIWATMIVVPHGRSCCVCRRLGGKRSLAVAGMTLALLLVFVVPFALAVLTIMNHADQIVGWVKGLATYALPPPPEWVGKMPLAGPKLAPGMAGNRLGRPGGVRSAWCPTRGIW